MPMKIIGLCGGSGSGKGVVSQIFLELGIPSVDTDAVYHEITGRNSACVDELASCFGKNIIDSNGGLNRGALSDIVFADDATAQLKLLNQITHRHILDKTRAIIEDYRKNGLSAVIIDAPLLFESGFDKECDITIAIVADRKVRIDRVVRRDGISTEAAARRIDSQIPDSELIKRCDYYIENNGDLSLLEDAVKKIAAKI